MMRKMMMIVVIAALEALTLTGCSERNGITEYVALVRDILLEKEAYNVTDSFKESPQTAYETETFEEDQQATYEAERIEEAPQATYEAESFEEELQATSMTEQEYFDWLFAEEATSLTEDAETAAQILPTEVAGKQGTSLETISVRTAPGSWNDILSILHSGTRVELLSAVQDDTGCQWYEVLLHNGSTGFVRAEFIQVDMQQP